MNFSDYAGEPLIYLITGGETTVRNFAEKKIEILDLVKTAVQKKISLIQIREKQLPARNLFEIASEASKITRGSRTKLLINDRADIALAANADGVHLTSKSLSAAVIRRFSDENFIIGVSAHTFEEAALARAQKADFVTFSPIFKSPGKGKPQGLQALREVCEKLKPFPVIALGGIDETNDKSALENGAAGFAAIRYLNNQLKISSIASRIRRVCEPSQ